MDCKQAYELITASLDGELESSQQAELEYHITACIRCRNEAELERITKAFLHHRFRQRPTPPQVASRIASQLALEARRTEPPAAPSRIRQLFTLTLPLRKTFFTLGGAIAILFLTFTFYPPGPRHFHVVPNDGNIIHQTYSSYDGLMKGDIAPQIISDDPTAVKAFFMQKVNFNVNVPRLKSCTLMGGTFGHYSDENVAQVIYKYGNDIIYLYEARLDSVMKQGGALNLPDEAKREIRRTGWYVENHVPDCTLIVWKTDSTTICCAVAEMSKDHLLACLQEVN